LIKHLQQPMGSKTCGQHCIAMFLGVPVGYVIEIMGNKGTRTRDVCRALGIPFSKLQKDHTPTCIAKITWYSTEKKRLSFGHWVLMVGDVVHDPTYPKPLTMDNFKKLTAMNLGKVTSYLPLEGVL
jgi:hypothetical protein